MVMEENYSDLLNVKIRNKEIRTEVQSFILESRNVENQTVTFWTHHENIKFVKKAIFYKEQTEKGKEENSAKKKMAR